ncbi:MAG: DNA mismatch repair protein MutS [Selenomonadaceae bacterium]|nr:DNA mismatch repair protein MutS [Selenomonadaceae bacterium]
MELTPMMQQYLAAKEEHPEEILFFRLGDFYEMFFDDARTVSRELGLTLTSRSGDTDKAPMCGVPYHAAESYINKLIRKGYKVAIAEQIGDPKAKGLTKREVIKIVTPGTVLSEAALPDIQNNYIALIYETGETIALAGGDISTGECFYGVYQGKDRLPLLLDELYRLMMPELLFVGELSFGDKLKEFVELRLTGCAFTKVPKPTEAAEERLAQHFAPDSRPENEAARLAVATLLDYLYQTVRTDLSHMVRLTQLNAAPRMVMDATTLRNLEITHNLRDGTRKDTLLEVLDFTETAMGGRLLVKWLEYPLMDTLKIEERLEAVAELKEGYALRTKLRESLEEIRDFERLLTRIEVGSANARDLIALKVSFACLPAVKKSLLAAKGRLLQQSGAGISLFTELADLIERAIVEEPGISLRDGGIIKDGYHAELDEYRRLARDSKGMLQEIEEREKRQTGIRSLKIGYNKVFGYYIEVRHSGKDLVPERYVRKQTLASAERYITEELKEFETKILGAQEKIVNIEYHLFCEVRDAVKEKLTAIQDTAREIARADVLAGLAEAAATYNYVRPRMADNGEIIIKDGRHPLVERLLTQELFVPNDTKLNHHDTEIALITGPNMAGKSTYMRQTALLTLLAQIGSFIPAASATISPVDRIFTRIGASDDLASGQSTFMMEMNEVAQILKYATRDSLIILDEVGRGTSTFDGMSIARAVVEHIAQKIHAKTMFATHYHELTDMEGDKIKNFCVAVKERGEQVSFLRRIVAGAADKSYGIQVARLAGLPKSLLDRAKQILTAMEQEEREEEKKAKTPPATAEKKVKMPPTANLFASELSAALLKLDVMSMTPLEALNELYKLQEQAKREAGVL